MSPFPARFDPEGEALRNPHRVAAARRLLDEVTGPVAFHRLSGLAARLLGVGHAKVTLFTEEDVVVGGFGLPDGVVVGGPARLTGAISAVVVCGGKPLAVPDARRDLRVADLPAVTSGEVGSYLGVPLMAASGHVVGALAVYDAATRNWSGDDAELLTQLAASVVAELELSAARSAVGTSRARLDIALEAGSIGIWERDLRTGTVYWDRRCAAIYGLDDERELAGDALLRHVHPDDHDLIQGGIGRAANDRGEYMAELRVLWPDGSVRWIVARGRVAVDAHGEPVRMLGTVMDVTDAREQAERRLAAVQRTAAMAEVAAELAGAVRMSQLADITLRGAQVLGAESGAIAAFDGPEGPLRLHLTARLVQAVEAGAHVELPADGVEVELDDVLPTQYAARHGVRVLLSDPEEAAARFPDMRQVNELLGTRALAAVPLRVEGQTLGAFVVTWTEDHPFPDDDVEVLEALAAQIALSVSRLRADAERDSAVAAMAEANRQLQLLADTGRVLSGSLGIDQQIQQLAELVVPALADWCWIVVTDESGRLGELACAHRDPGRREELEHCVRGMVATMTDDAAARTVIRTGRPVILPELDRARLERVLPDPAVRADRARFGLGSTLVVPLVASGQPIGALGLVNDRDRAPHSEAEVETALEMGRRAGLSLQHARLFGQQRALADVLQRSMLTEPPHSDQCEIVVRYQPAAEGAEVGGDWYDAFLQPGGATVLAIGDVVGHDVRAAAAMGQVRGLLRGIGYARGGSPAEVLTELDRAVHGFGIDTMATALVARLETEDPRRDDTRSASRLRPGQVLLRWASAGHPPPVVLRTDGQVAVLDGMPADLLLGVLPDTRREDRAVILGPGDTVLLYTDGLVERRDRDIDAGTDELVAVLGECAGLPLDEVCDGVLQRMFLPDAEDDVALLAVRLR